MWSSWSKSINTSGDCAKKYNYIGIDYTDEIFDCLNDSNQLHLIDKVMLGYRNTNNGELYSFITIDNPNFLVYYKFPNMKNVTGMFTEEDDVQITRKIHGIVTGKFLIA